MPRILTKLRIDEVSAVDRGAGEGVKVILMKRQEAARPPRYNEFLKLLKGEGDDADMGKRRGYWNTVSPVTGAVYPKDRVPDDDVDSEEDEMDVVDKADRGGAHDLAGALLQHLQDRLEHRREQHGYQKRKEGPLDQHQELISIMKDCGGPVSLCKGIVDRGRSPCGETELVTALTKYASEQHPSLRPDTAFAALYESQESVRRACNIAKAAGPMFDVAIVQPGDVTNTESSEAYRQLEALAAKLHAAATGKMSKEQAFAAVFTDPVNRELAQKAHRTPTAPAGGAYPFPR
jgi:hypothetical protein